MKRKILGISLLSAMTLCSAISLSACGGDTPIVDSEIKDVFWSGTQDIDLNMGDAIPDLLKGVTAESDTGKALTVKIDEEASDEIDTSVNGSFTVYYVAYDGDTLVSEEKGGSATRTVNVMRGTYIEDNDFKTGQKFSWAGNGNAGSEMSWKMNKDNESLEVDIKNSGQEHWQNQVEFNGLSVKKDTTYEITVRAKSTTGRNIGASLEVPAEGYRLIEDNSTNVLGYKTSTEYQDFKYYYTASEDFDGVKFGITLGRFNEDDDAPSVVNIDKVEIKAMDKKANSTGIVFENADEVVYKVGSLQDYLDLPVVTAKDSKGNKVELTKEGAVQKEEFASELAKATFGEIYKYVDKDGNLSYYKRQINYAPSTERAHEHSTLDGEFNSGAKFWNKEENGLVAISENKAENTVTIAATQDSTNEPDWKAQLQQNNIDGQILRAGVGYKAVCKAKTTNKDVKTLRLEFCAAANNPNAKKDLIFEENNVYQEFETEVFTPETDITGGNLRVGLLLGEYSAKYELTVDYIDIVEVAPEREFEHSTLDGEFARGTNFWTEEENGLIDIKANRQDHTVTIEATKDSTTEPDWKAQLQQNDVKGAKLTKGKKYKAICKAKTSNKDVKTLRLEFCAGANNPAAKEDLIFTENDKYQEFETAVFTPENDVTGGALRVGLLLGEYSAKYTLTVDYIQIVEVK